MEDDIWLVSDRQLIWRPDLPASTTGSSQHAAYLRVCEHPCSSGCTPNFTPCCATALLLLTCDITIAPLPRRTPPVNSFVSVLNKSQIQVVLFMLRVLLRLFMLM